MACVPRAILGLSTLFVFAKAIGEDFDASGSFRFDSVIDGPPKTLSNNNSDVCEKQLETGYECCNQVLKEVIVKTMKDLDEKGSGVSKGLGYSKCNTHYLAKKLQSRAEKAFKHAVAANKSIKSKSMNQNENQLFEAIVSFGHFEQKLHVVKNLICKIRVEDKNILLYGADTIIETTTTAPFPARAKCGEVKKFCESAGQSLCPNCTRQCPDCPICYFVNIAC